MHSEYQPTTDSEEPAKKILAPIDFSPPSQRALIHALHVAHQTRAHLNVIHVSEPIPCPRGCSALEYLADQKLHRDRIKNEISALVAKLWLGAFDGTLETTAVEGVAPHEIVEAAKRNDMDLIVIATYGRTGFKRFVLGSTADKVVRFAPCSVLVVKKKLKEAIPLSGSIGKETDPTQPL